MERAYNRKWNILHAKGAQLHNCSLSYGATPPHLNHINETTVPAVLSDLATQKPRKPVFTRLPKFFQFYLTF